MAEIKPMALIESMKKKVCMHSDVYFRTNKRTGKVTTGKLCNPSDKPASELQLAAQQAMKTKTAAVRAYMRAQKALDTPSEEYMAIKRAYEAQHKIGSLFGFIMHRYDDYESVITA